MQARQRSQVQYRNKVRQRQSKDGSSHGISQETSNSTLRLKDQVSSPHGPQKLLTTAPFKRATSIMSKT